MDSIEKKIAFHVGNFYEKEDCLYLIPVTMLIIKHFEEMSYDYIFEEDTKIFSAGLIYSVVNRLTDEKLIDESDCTISDVTSAFDFDVQEIIEHAEIIERTCNDQGFDIAEMFVMVSKLMETEELLDDGEDLGFEFPMSAIWINEFRINVGTKKNAKANLISDFNKVTEELSVRYSGNESKNKPSILKVFETDERIYFQVKCLKDDSEFYKANVKSLGNFEYTNRVLFSGVNLYGPDLAMSGYIRSAIYMERIVHESMDDDEIAAATLDLMQYDIDHPEEKDLLLKILDLYFMEGEEAKRLGKEMLKEHNNSIELGLFMAGWKMDYEKRLSMIEEGIEKGEVLFSGKGDSGEVFHIENSTSRTYLRALRIYARELEIYGYLEDSIEMYEDLLTKDNSDGVLARYGYAEILIDHKKWDEYKELRSRFQDDDHPLFLYGDFLYNYIRYGKNIRTKNALFKALEVYPEVIDLLLFDDFEEHEITDLNYVFEFLSIVLERFLIGKKFAKIFGLYIAQYSAENPGDIDREEGFSLN